MIQVDSKWVTIDEFPNYEIDQYGQIYNSRTHTMMRTSQTNHGHEKITLTREELDEDDNWVSVRHTRSVALLVAQAFVEQPNIMCDHVIVLDGNYQNIVASNLAWRPGGFAYRYTRQLKVDQPIHYRNLHVLNVEENVEYRNIIQAGMMEGLLFDDIWRSTYTGSKVFPYGNTFEITERV